MEMELGGHAPEQARGGPNGFQSLDRRALVLTIVGLQLTLLLAALDNTIVGTAMPKIIAQLSGFDRYAWVTTAYLLTSTTAVPIFGKLSDMYGRKWFFLAGAALFVTASALCGAAGDIPGLPGDGMTQLIFFRAVQGLASGIITGLTFTIVGDLFPPAERGKYQGLFSGVWGLASVFGPTLGGWITDNLSWRWCFYVNLPVGIAAMLVLYFSFPDIRPAAIKRQIDWFGVGTLVGCLVPLLLALTWVTDYGWTSSRVIGLLAVAVIMLGAFLLAESRAAEPILPLSLFRSRLVVVSSISLFLTGMGMFGSILFIPLFMQAVIGVSATQSGSLLTPLMLMLTAGSILSGWLTSRTGRYKVLAILGLAIMTCGMVLLGRMGMSTTKWECVQYMMVVGIGLGLVMPLYTLIVQNAVPQQMMGVATASTQFFRSIGGTVGSAVFGSIMLSQYRTYFDSHLPAQVTQAPNAGQILGAFKNPLQLSSIMGQLQQEFAKFPNGLQILATLLDNVKESLVQSLSSVFLIGAVLVAISFVANFFLPEIALRKSFAAAEQTEAVAGAEGAYATGKAASEQPIPAFSVEGDD